MKTKCGRALESDKEHLGMLFQLFINRRLSSPVQEEGNREEDDRVVLKHFLTRSLFPHLFPKLIESDGFCGGRYHAWDGRKREVDRMVLFLRDSPEILSMRD